jgi:hypothetical protein
MKNEKPLTLGDLIALNLPPETVIQVEDPEYRDFDDVEIETADKDGIKLVFR